MGTSLVLGPSLPWTRTTTTTTTTMATTTTTTRSSRAAPATTATAAAATAMLVVSSLVARAAAAAAAVSESALELRAEQHAQELSPLWTLLIFCVVMAISTFVLGSLPLFVRLSPTQMVLLQSLAAGLLLGAGITIVLPEGVSNLYTPSPEHAPASTAAENSHKDAHRYSPEHALGTSVLVGFLLMFFVDRTFSAKHTHFHHTTPAPVASQSGQAADTVSPTASATPSSRRGSGGGDSLRDFSRASLTSLFGLVIHAFTDGIAMGATSLTSSSSSSSSHAHQAAGPAVAAREHSEADDAAASLRLIVFLAIMLHKAPAALGLSTLLLSQGGSRLAILRAMAVFALSTPAGALVTYAVGWWILENSPLVASSRLGQGAASNSTLAAAGSAAAAAAAAAPPPPLFVPPMAAARDAVHALAEGGGLSPRHIGMALTFSAGTFLYVAMHALGELMGGSGPESSSSDRHHHLHHHHHQHQHQPHSGYAPVGAHDDDDAEDEDEGDEFAEGHHHARRGGRGGGGGSTAGSDIEDQAGRARRRSRTASKEEGPDPRSQSLLLSPSPDSVAGTGPGPTSGSASSAAGSVASSSPSAGEPKQHHHHHLLLSAAGARPRPLDGADEHVRDERRTRRRGGGIHTQQQQQQPQQLQGPPRRPPQGGAAGRKRWSPFALELAKTALLLLGAAVPRLLQGLTGGHGH